MDIEHDFDEDTVAKGLASVVLLLKAEMLRDDAKELEELSARMRQQDGVRELYQHTMSVISAATAEQQAGLEEKGRTLGKEILEEMAKQESE